MLQFISQPDFAQRIISQHTTFLPTMQTPAELIFAQAPDRDLDRPNVIRNIFHHFHNTHYLEQISNENNILNIELNLHFLSALIEKNIREIKKSNTRHLQSMEEKYAINSISNGQKETQVQIAHQQLRSPGSDSTVNQMLALPKQEHPAQSSALYKILSLPPINTYSKDSVANLHLAQGNVPLWYRFSEQVFRAQQNMRDAKNSLYWKAQASLASFFSINKPLYHFPVPREYYSESAQAPSITSKRSTTKLLITPPYAHPRHRSEMSTQQTSAGRTIRSTSPHSTPSSAGVEHPSLQAVREQKVVEIPTKIRVTPEYQLVQQSNCPETNIQLVSYWQNQMIGAQHLPGVQMSEGATMQINHTGMPQSRNLKIPQTPLDFPLSDVQAKTQTVRQIPVMNTAPNVIFPSIEMVTSFGKQGVSSQGMERLGILQSIQQGISPIQQQLPILQGGESALDLATYAMHTHHPIDAVGMHTRLFPANQPLGQMQGDSVILPMLAFHQTSHQTKNAQSLPPNRRSQQLSHVTSNHWQSGEGDAVLHQDKESNHGREFFQASQFQARDAQSLPRNKRSQQLSHVASSHWQSEEGYAVLHQDKEGNRGRESLLSGKHRLAIPAMHSQHPKDALIIGRNTKVDTSAPAVIVYRKEQVRETSTTDAPSHATIRDDIEFIKKTVKQPVQTIYTHKENTAINTPTNMVSSQAIMPNLDQHVNAIADKVYNALERRLRSERMRKGLL